MVQGYDSFLLRIENDKVTGWRHEGEAGKWRTDKGDLLYLDKFRKNNRKFRWTPKREQDAIDLLVKLKVDVI